MVRWESPASGVDLVVPVKSLHTAKSRLLRSLRTTDYLAHRELVLAMLTDTLLAAMAATAVHRVAVVTPDPDVRATAAALGAIPLIEPARGGLNRALAYGESFLRATGPHRQMGALQADLPALRPVEVDDAVALAHNRRAFCADWSGRGTTLLLAGRDERLKPRFGSDSAQAHRDSGAVDLAGCWPTLRCDVDIARGLATAAALGLGHYTLATLHRHRCCQPAEASAKRRIGSSRASRQPPSRCWNDHTMTPAAPSADAIEIVCSTRRVVVP